MLYFHDTKINNIEDTLRDKIKYLENEILLLKKNIMSLNTNIWLIGKTIVNLRILLRSAHLTTCLSWTVIIILLVGFRIL